jgi:membrane protein
MLDKIKQIWSFLHETVTGFLQDDCMTMAGALAYYAMFSIPPMLLIVTTITGMIWGEEDVRGHVEEELLRILGEPAKNQVLNMMEHARSGGNGPLATWLSIGLLIFASTGFMMQLQSALNRCWHIEVDQKWGGIKNFVIKRILSFAMVLTLAFLLLVSLTLTTALSIMVHRFHHLLPGGMMGPLAIGIDTLVTMVVVTLLITMIFKWFPDGVIRWRDVWIGGAVTGTLFLVGKFPLGWYLGGSDSGTYGAGGALVLLLLWVYFNSIIVLYGAQFTQVWARRFGRRIVPDPGAVRVTYTRHPEPGPGATNDDNSSITNHQPSSAKRSDDR